MWLFVAVESVAIVVERSFLGVRDPPLIIIFVICFFYYLQWWVIDYIKSKMFMVIMVTINY